MAFLPRTMGAISRGADRRLAQSDCFRSSANWVTRKVNSVRFDEPEYTERINLDYVPLLKSDPNQR